MGVACRIGAGVVLAAVAWSADAAERCGAVDGPSGRPALSHPADGPVISGFGPRQDPIRQIRRLHTGIDYAGAVGDPVFAAAAGEVVSSEVRGAYGAVIVVRHDALGLETLYAHLSRRDVEVGDCVQTHQIIGAIGESGTSSAAHLHFEVAAKVDPLRYLPPLAP